MVDRVRLKRYRCSVTKIEQIFLLRVSITLDSMHTNTHTHTPYLVEYYFVYIIISVLLCCSSQYPSLVLDFLRPVKTKEQFARLDIYQANSTCVHSLAYNMPR